MGSVSRRGFLGAIGAATTTACVRKPVEKIVPFSERPEDRVPGRPLYYATALQSGGSVQGLLVESHDGRPTKIEGNPRHSGSQGATDAWAQASVLGLYDPSRSAMPIQRTDDGASEQDWTTAIAAVRGLLDAAESDDGQGLGIVVRYDTSPTFRAQLRRFRRRFPAGRIFLDDPAAPIHSISAAEGVGGGQARMSYNLRNAKIVLAADCDFLGTGVDHVRLTREWATRRKLERAGDDMSRLYVVEPHLTCTGAAADHRFPLRAHQVGGFLRALASELLQHHIKGLRPVRGAQTLLQSIGGFAVEGKVQRLVRTLASDLTHQWQTGAEPQSNLGKSVILVGERQPTWVHALGMFLNTTLHNIGQGARWRTDQEAVGAEPIAALAVALEAGQIGTLVCLGTNPAYDAPGELDLRAKLESVQTLIHAGERVDETAALAHWHLPVSHYLEAWGDVEAADGVVSICQPLIEPLLDTYSLLEVTALVGTGRLVDGYTLVRSYWSSLAGGQLPEYRWERWLHDGVVTGVARESQLPKERRYDPITAVVAGATLQADSRLEIDFHLDPKVCDGRYAANGWLQELPHPITKLTWDNAAYIGARTARRLGVETGDRVKLAWDGRSIETPVWVAPGQAEGTISLTLGYGREGTGSVADGVGVDVYRLRSASQPWWGLGVTVEKLEGRHALVSSQEHGTMDEGFTHSSRAIVRTADLGTFRKNPTFAGDADAIAPKQNRSLLFRGPTLHGQQQWGMSIDLNSCTGCSACVIACQAENNIPVVGKDRVSEGREMHWIRIDRYYAGDPGNPRVQVQPMPCQHCENAPCETVCPVAATSHSPEGLNDMAYNRCIGTRYCSNNCPYKVRRFNFFNYNLDIDSVSRMRNNPDVTIRFRGVMEKCTYCVQRINAAKIAAKVDGRDLVADGAIRTACQQVCPGDAISFGDINDPGSVVHQRKRNPRNYAVLADLNNHPRTTYLARVDNPHPDLKGWQEGWYRAGDAFERLVTRVRQTTRAVETE